VKRRIHEYILLVLDWLVINAAFALALSLETGIRPVVLLNRIDTTGPLLGFALGYSLFVLFIFRVNNLYKISLCIRVGQHAVQILKSLAYAIIGMGVLAFLLDRSLAFDSRLLVVYFFNACLGGLLLVRLGLFRNIFRFGAKHGLIRRKTLLVGTGPTARKLQSGLEDRNLYGLAVVGVIDFGEQSPLAHSVDLPILGKSSDVERVVRENSIKEIILAMDNVTDEEFWEMADTCTKTKAHLLVAATEQFAVISERMYLEEYGEIPLFGLMNFNPYYGVSWLHRLIEILVASVGIVMLLPVFIVVALAIKIDSRGSIIYAQRRIGKDGKPFSFYKFRSMFVGSDLGNVREQRFKDFINEGRNGEANGYGNGVSTKIVDESRITRVGRLIRRTSIDELPQLFNVIRGDMSLVGPRPCLPYELEHYEAWHKRRMQAKPGCTGLWQVLARSQVGFREMVILDNFYVYNASYHLDVWLLMKTVPVILFSMGGK
jgi:exopolysaccharide biosynthesis polyprenyl glycosylphosphotransferase